jgi:hypothetical protein
MSREWVRFFDDLRRAIISSLDESVGNRLDNLEAEALFPGGDGAAGGGSSYNDFAVRARIEAIETELMFPQAIPRNDAAEMEARLALLKETADATTLDLMFTRQPPHVRDLRSRLEAVELALATIEDGTAKLRLVLQRLAALETQNLFD